MRSVLLVGLILFVSVSSLFFSNCAKSNISGGPGLSEFSMDQSSISDQTSNQYNLSCLPSKLGRSLSEGPLAASDEISPEMIEKGVFVGQELSVTVDAQCMVTTTKFGLFSKDFSHSIPELINRNTATFLWISTVQIPPSDVRSKFLDDPCVLSIYPNVRLDVLATQVSTPNDPQYLNQNFLKTINHDKIYSRVFNAFNGINQTVKVAVIDTGVDVNHPDLRNNYILDSNFKVLGLNAIDNNNVVQDSLFHGSHVAGIIGAISNNGVGVSGVLGQSIKIIPVRVSSNGSSIDSAATVNGIRWAADQGAEVINMSLGGQTPSEDMRLAIEYAIKKGVVVVVAAGNNGLELYSGFSIYPAKWGSQFEGMLTVGSIDATTLARSSFSNFSPTFVEIMAPGSDGLNGILSTVPTSLSSGYASKVTTTAGTSPIQGTSMASPVVAGAAAMVIALAKSRGYRPLPAQVEKIIKRGSILQPSLSGLVENSQRLDLKTLIDTIDAEMGIDSNTENPRNSGHGLIAIAKQPSNQKVLLNQPFTLEVELTSDSSVFVNYQWFKNGKSILGATNPTLNITSANSQSGGKYYVELRSGVTYLRSQSVDVFTGQSYCGN